jgi:hypothetical protein
MKNYFSHDEGARNDPKLIKVLMKLGQAGKGVYWDLIEMLYEQNGRLSFTECDSYAFALRTECDILKSLITDFDLFENDGVNFWSNSVLVRLEMRKGKSRKASESANKRWEDANAMRTHSERNASAMLRKEKKVKEKKEERSADDDFLFQMFRRCALKDIPDEVITLEVGKFRNKYPDTPMNRAGPLVNAWATRLTNEPRSSGKKEMVH